MYHAEPSRVRLRESVQDYLVIEDGIRAVLIQQCNAVARCGPAVAHVGPWNVHLSAGCRLDRAHRLAGDIAGMAESLVVDANQKRLWTDHIRTGEVDAVVVAGRCDGIGGNYYGSLLVFQVSGSVFRSHDRRDHRHAQRLAYGIHEVDVK